MPNKAIEYHAGDVVALKGRTEVATVTAVIRDGHLDGVYLERELCGARYWRRERVQPASFSGRLIECLVSMVLSLRGPEPRKPEVTETETVPVLQ